MQTAQHIREQFNDQRANGKRAKDAAEALGLGEGAAVAAHLGEHEFAPKAVLLRKDWLELLKSLEACGPLLALTRNESTVHEKTGVYTNLSASGHIGMALGEAIDLRLFFDRWHAGFAVKELAANPQNRPNWSLQFFDASGKAVHKIFTRDATAMVAWEAVIDRFTADTQIAPEFVAPTPKKEPKPDSQLDAAALSAAWANMKDTHEFFKLLNIHEAERQQSFRLVEGRFTQRLARDALRELLLGASFDGTPIMCFVSSGGCIQIHSGPVKRIEPMEIHGTAWLNVIDPGFNLHLREDSIAQVWLVEKPTSDGVVTSVEAFDHEGDLMAMFFGARKPGKPELQAWRDIAHALPKSSTTELIAELA